MKIAILSNVTCEVLASKMRPECETWTPPGYGAWVQTALDPPEELRAFSPDAVFFVLDPQGGAHDAALERSAQDALSRALPLSAVFPVDVRAVERSCSVPFRDPRMWKIAKMPWSLAGIEALRAEILRLMSLMAGGAKKVLALDFDNTLWDGVVGEDGPGGIAPRRAFQEAVLGMKRRGIVLVGLSKNTPETVEPVWRDPRMVLKKEDFAILKIGWEPKAENLAACAAELNLSPGAFVFVDDNPAERERMKAFSPETAVPDFPRDASGLGEFARELERLYFPVLPSTAEDAAKTGQYLAEARRRAAAADMTAEEYLKRLEIALDIHPLREGEVARVAQLLAKSNQFNVLTVRRTAAEVASMVEAPGSVALSVSAKDRFGDYGLIAFLRAVVSGGEARVEDFAMSCRAMGRRIEYAAEAALEKAVERLGAKILRARRKTTAKNAPVERLFDSFGFVRERADAGSADYSLALPRSVPLPPHCARLV